MQKPAVYVSKPSDELACQILQVVALIPYGKVASYGQIAKLAGLPKHARLVGYVLKHLDALTEIPWHRVINAQGKMSRSQVDEAGDNSQRLKLMAEGVQINADRVNLKRYQWLSEQEHSLR